MPGQCVIATTYCFGHGQTSPRSPLNLACCCCASAHTVPPTERALSMTLLLIKTQPASRPSSWDFSFTQQTFTECLLCTDSFFISSFYKKLLGEQDRCQPHLMELMVLEAHLKGHPNVLWWYRMVTHDTRVYGSYEVPRRDTNFWSGSWIF